MFDLIVLTSNLSSYRERLCVLAPKEQPPRKLSGKRTDKKHNTLERDLISPMEQKLSGKHTDGAKWVL